jgi:hypothetical protein
MEIGTPRWVEWTQVVPLNMPVTDDDTSTLPDELAPFATAELCAYCGCSKLIRLIAWRCTEPKLLTRWVFFCPECEVAVVATQRRPPRIVVSQPEINPFSPFLNTINQDFCPASRLYYFDVSRETFRRGSPAYAGSFRVDYRTARPTIVATLGAQWTEQFGVSPPEHLDVVHVTETSAVAFDPEKGRLHALAHGRPTLRFVPTDSAGA